jgi:hypothetical protein
VQPAQRLDPGPAQLVPAVAQQPQHLQIRINRDLRRSLVAQRHYPDRVRVGGVGLAALPGVEHPRPGGQLGRHVDHALPVGQQPRRDRPPDPVRAVHGPGALWPQTGEPQQLPVAAPSVPDRPRARSTSRSSRASIVTDALCGSIPITTRSITRLLTDGGNHCQRGRATLFRADQQTLLEPRPAAVTGPAHATGAEGIGESGPRLLGLSVPC